MTFINLCGWLLGITTASADLISSCESFLRAVYYVHVRSFGLWHWVANKSAQKHAQGRVPIDEEHFCQCVFIF